MKQVFVLLFFIMGISLHAQDKHALGIRGGFNNGLTYRNYASSSKAYEFILSPRWGGWSITGLIEYYNPLGNEPGLTWFYGFGAHLGTYRTGKPNVPAANDNLLLGVDGIIGIDYKFQKLPLNISLDAKPEFNIVPTFLDLINFNLSFRFTF
ncbi:hypothetical protein JCM31826_04600 [Thermaurantimonas aggregans]|uniref:Outer membrane protein beta-barrel domain-containing protein n=1 Tax=Thermaurantimonas aggregans TaxID=2173829 RepID=A0A401XJ08_9FLAO|nr:hypothetical protein [Thermaurantimonas aggregans]MCX8149006.1 hypothetical protein [Thermaurantimonas aggregans]GCD76978.1 hypothetical protein JCM31826_04600 [Thermaurantimonas aggregans]